MKQQLSIKRFLRRTGAAAVVEFALVVPILFLLVWGIISFSRAYQRLNALTSSLREGARVASTLDNLVSDASRRTQVRTAIKTFSSAFGYSVDTSLVNINASNVSGDVRVGVVNYPIFSGLSFVGGLSSITVTREAVFRCERSCGS
ncbi:MAG TPA: TadE/TadG family type IV pilus assembly protein [Gemmatimonadaceae bacterium]